MPARIPPRKVARVWKAQRRKAEQLFEAGERQSAVARKLNLSRQCVHNWFWEWQHADGPVQHLQRQGSGRKAKLTPEQLAAVDGALRRGPHAFGFAAERWTLWRIAAIIERITGVQYHASSVWRILRTLGWSLQVPPADGKPKRYMARSWVAPVTNPFDR
jgi:transposase